MYSNIKAAVVGSINMDLILTMDRVPETGENLPGNSYDYANGGKGANQATALARLGAQVKMIGKVANDPNGKKLLLNLQSKGIDVSGVSSKGTQTGLAIILLDSEGRNRIVVYEGANKEIEINESLTHLTDDLDLLLIQFETDESVVTECVNYAIKNNITTVIDCGPAKNFDLEKMQGAHIISPNESETKALTGIYPDSENTILEASKILMERSKAKYVVLKLGDRGSSIWDGKTLTVIPSLPTNVVDTTAAGDCFTAAMALHYIKTGNILESCKIGNRAGSYAVSHMGAENSMPSYDNIK